MQFIYNRKKITVDAWSLNELDACWPLEERVSKQTQNLFVQSGSFHASKYPFVKKGYTVDYCGPGFERVLSWYLKTTHNGEINLFEMRSQAEQSAFWHKIVSVAKKYVFVH